MMINAFQENFERAVRLAKQGDFFEAEDLFKQLSVTSPQNIATFINYGTILFQSRKFNEAKMAFTQAIDLDYMNYIGYYNRALCFYAQKDNENALHDFTFALSFLGVLKGKKLERIELLDESIRFCDDNAIAYIQRGKLYDKKGNFEKAEKDFHTAVKLREMHPLPYLERAEFYWRNNRVKEGQKDLKKYHELKREEGISLKPKLDGVSQIYGKEELMEKIRELVVKFKILYQQEKEIVQEMDRKEVSSSFLDSSKNISKQIQRLQSQIKEEKGSFIDNEGSSLNEETFLTAQIQKVADDIEKHKRKVQQAEHSQTSSFSSKFTQPKLLDPQVLKQYSVVKFEITSASIFQNEQTNGYGDGRVKICYLDKKVETPFIRSYIWNHKCSFPIKNEEYSVEVELQVKGKGFWSANVIVGKGQINILQKGETKCILYHGEVKTGIIHFKIKLVE